MVHALRRCPPATRHHRADLIANTSPYEQDISGKAGQTGGPNAPSARHHRHIRQRSPYPAHRWIEAKAVADAVFPARDEPFPVGDDQISVKDDKVLNRLKAYMIEQGGSPGRIDRLRRTVGYLYERVSKGVHDDVTPDEARFVFLHTYTTLGEILSLGEGLGNVTPATEQ